MKKKVSSNSSKFKFELLLSLLVGVLIGVFLSKSYSSVSADLWGEKGPTSGSITVLSKTPIRNTVHVDSEGRAITKQQLLEPFVIPNLVGVSIATFLPGQTMMPPHQHETMHELFYVIEGSGTFQIDGVDHELGPGTLLHLSPKEMHGIWVPKEKGEPLKMLVTGVTVGEKKK